ncbi:LLM class flavin-dependent oxidoreductase [Acidisphaera sp. S103]|uniref:LLM class flavin-dependent oxidoreductase n=1 Tax=Acidisphaera sp. S103 TaxID=1747223 RepID=UPI00131BF286|nr:LLM class flavin-dependent oxidoreductase [Acidisphaera sp. S103]
MDRRELHLNINILNAGFHAAAWRTPSSDPAAFVNVRHYVEVAKIAERGTFDAVFLADTPSFADRPDYRPYQALEPTIVLATIAAATDRIGLIGTASSTYNDPYNLARRFATLDLASGGRTGWNVVTTADPGASRNFGFDNVTAHRDRYERAAEFCHVVKALWDSWQDDALVGDKATGQFVDVARVHPIQHAGHHFKVRGPLNVPRSPQGQPVLIQAGGSEDGRNLAALHAEAIFSVAQTEADGLEFARNIRTRAERFGRTGPIVFLPGLATTIGSTEAEVKQREQALWDLLPTEYSIGRIAGLLQIDPDRLELDRPLPDNVSIPEHGMQTFAAATLRVAQQDRLTLRQLLRKLGGGTGHRLLTGTPEQIADDIERWFLCGAADGFNLMPDVLPEGLETFVDHVVPILRRKGIFRHRYTGHTLRDHFGLVRPGDSLAAQRRTIASAA